MQKKDTSSSKAISRRSFGKLAGVSAAATFGFQFIPSHAWGQLTKPTLAGIGSGGKGKADIGGSDYAGFHIVALADVVVGKKIDKPTRKLKSVAEMQERYNEANLYSDYREMLDAMGDKIDAVTVSTPDHHHFHASVLAMQAGKHVYCQKPLCHGIWEARTMTRIAKETGIKTQMGNQAHANDHMRRCIELIRSGIIGKVKEVHAWTNRPVWPQGFAKAPEKQPVPEWLDWEQWIGPAPWVDYNEVIAPFAWRGWHNYGTGALGDMACHIMDMGYWALMPGAPKSVKAEQNGGTELSPPINSIIEWEFGPSQYVAKDGLKYVWYDGYVDATFDRKSWTLKKASNEYNHPGPEVLEGKSFKDFGSVIIGEEGKLFFHRQRNNWIVETSSKIDNFEWPKPSIHRAGGPSDKNANYVEWMDAIKGKVDDGLSGFHHAGPFTEVVLLGVIAQRNSGQKLEWNSKKMEIKGRPDLKKLIQRDYRKGWEIKV
jgi:predicted dehydrogenase